MTTKLLKGNNIELLKTLEDNSIDSVLTDAPYGLSFMNKKWDYDVPSVELWKEVYRVLKPGGHILCFGGTRTYHRMVVNIEDAGFEIRDCIQWIYGSGFPKSLNIGKSMDEYEGWGTGLKPANEPIVLARKPLDEKTIVQNVKEWGTGGINIDGCRISTDENLIRTGDELGNRYANFNTSSGKGNCDIKTGSLDGRFPANVILECTCDEVIKGEKGEVKINNNGNIKTGDNGIYGQYKEIVRTNFTDKGDIHTNPNCPCYIMDEQSGESKSSGGNSGVKKTTGISYSSNDKWQDDKTSKGCGFGDTGGASRFFYVAKVSKKERNMGLDGFEEKQNIIYMNNTIESSYKTGSGNLRNTKMKNNHPTVKPINLLTYLCRMITPPNGVVLDMYMGSGSTGIAALLEGFNFVGMEMDEEYFNIAEARINNYEEYRKILK